MNENAVSLEYFRNTARDNQLLSGTRLVQSGRSGIFDTINTLGYLQIDTISVVQRAHHHTLWTRNPDYTPSMIDELLTVDRLIFEYWGHAASYLPMADYRYYTPLMAAHTRSPPGWVKDWLAQNSGFLDVARKRIKEEGPLSSKDFSIPDGTKNKGWWSWKSTKMALEILFWQGELMIAGRRNFQRIYDLTERVLPSWVDTRTPDREELAGFLITRALSAHGVANESDIRNHLPLISKKVLSEVLHQFVSDRKIISLTNPAIDRLPYYASAEPSVQAGLVALGQPDNICHILSPFDNFVILRDRVKKLFGFEYTIECYVPAAKRKFGYFSLPVLFRNQFAGRMDAKADRKQKVLIVKNFVFEPDFKPDDCFWVSFCDKVKSFMRFNGCGTIEVEAVRPAKVKGKFKRKLESRS